MFFLTEDDVTLSFSNLQRGTNYRFVAWINNFAINPTVMKMNYTSMVDSTNSTNVVPLRTSDIQMKQFIKFDFINTQS